MKFLLLVPVVLSLLVLGAHFLRSGSLLVVLGVLALCFVLLAKRPWAARLVQAVLVLGALEWARTLWVLAGRRAAAGEPATRMAMILGGVALVTLGSALLFQTRTLAEHYGLAGRPKDGSPPESE